MKKEPLNVEQLHDDSYLARWAAKLAQRYPQDYQLAIVLGFLVGKATK